jgi:hypothetical protein
MKPTSVVPNSQTAAGTGTTDGAGPVAQLGVGVPSALLNDDMDKIPNVELGFVLLSVGLAIIEKLSAIVVCNIDHMLIPDTPKSLSHLMSN